jgi:hypothetical protein
MERARPQASYPLPTHAEADPTVAALTAAEVADLEPTTGVWTDRDPVDGVAADGARADLDPTPVDWAGDVLADGVADGGSDDEVPTNGSLAAAERTVADLAVAAGRELSTEQLVVHARALGPDPRLSGVPDDELERRFVSHTVALNAATARWFELLAEVVVRGLWADQGARTPAQWLSWRIGLAPSTAREQLRVAVRLRELPEVAERFAAGRLSYSKVRAITRIAVPELQQLLLAWAEHATGADLDRIARGVTQARRAGSVDGDLRAPMGTELRYDDDAVVISLRLPAEEGLEVYQALERLADAEQALQEAELGPGESLPDISRTQLMAEVALAVILAAKDRTPPDTSGLDRHTLTIELDANDLTREDGQVPVRVPEHRLPAMSARVLRRLACNAGVVTVAQRHGRPLDVGRRQREPNAQQRRALRARDRSCRFPGCGATRHLHAHHVIHWADGGPTDLDNLILVCSFHHRLIHQPGWRLEHLGHGRYRFHRPDGRPVPAAPSLQPLEVEPEPADLVDPTALTPTSWSTDDPLDLDLIISVVDQELRLTAPHLLATAA